MLSHCSLFLKRPAGFIYFLSGRRTLCNGMQGGNATRGGGAEIRDVLQAHVPAMASTSDLFQTLL